MPPKRKAAECMDANSAGEGVLHFLRCQEKSSDKFYELSIEGNRVTSRYGRNGTNGATVFKDFDSRADALTFVASTLSEKLKKGYVEEEQAATGSPKPAAPTTAPAPAPAQQAEPNALVPEALPLSAIDKADSGNPQDTVTGSDTTYLECVEKGSSKFYEIIRTGDKVSIRYGRISTDGVQSDKEFSGDVAAAVKFVEKTVAEKVKKGYKQAEAAVAGQAKAFTACNQEFRADRATIHLFSQEEANDEGSDGGDEEEDDGDSPGIYKMDKKSFQKLRPYLRRGDLLENVLESGYRSSGLYIYDGKNVTHLGDDLDDYGCMHKSYVIYKEFNPHYWDFSSMNVHNLLVPETDHTSAGWHSGDYPCAYVYAPAIKAAVDLKVHFHGVDYPIEADFKAWVDSDPDPEEAGEFAYVGVPDDYILVGLVYE